jgi:hypothetical protein
MLGGAGAAPLAQHRLHAAIARPAVVERAHGFDQLDQRGVFGDEGIDA